MDTASFCVASGKGGVGKTNITLNLGFALHSLGKKVILTDCDMGLANLDVLLGITPKKTIHDLLKPQTSVQDILIELAPGFNILPAASGVAELSEFDQDLQAVLLEKLNTVFHNCDYLFFDIGAGISPSILSFAQIPQERILILTPEPTSLTDTYAFIKIFSTQTRLQNFQIIVNTASSQKEARTAFERLQQACKNFLQIDIHFLGTVRQDDNLQAAVHDQKPLFLSNKKSPACQDILKIAKQLILQSDNKTSDKKTKLLQQVSMKK